MIKWKKFKKIISVLFILYLDCLVTCKILLKKLASNKP
nr:MAG TPA: hypothetical protein [Caudoviricetes sp.]